MKHFRSEEQGPGQVLQETSEESALYMGVALSVPENIPLRSVGLQWPILELTNRPASRSQSLLKEEGRRLQQALDLREEEAMQYKQEVDGLQTEIQNLKRAVWQCVVHSMSGGSACC